MTEGTDMNGRQIADDPINRNKGPRFYARAWTAERSPPPTAIGWPQDTLILTFRV